MLGALAATARAQTFPSRPISVIVPYPSGGPADVTARLVEPVLRRSLGQPLIVENIGGVSGALGIQKLLNAPADGHTVLMGTPSDTILGPLGVAAVRHKPEQLRMLGLASRAPLMLVGSSRLPARTLDDVLRESRRPGAKGYTYGSIGIGSLYHLVAEDFAMRLGIPITHVPYKGMGPVVQDLAGGQLDLAFLPTAGNLLDLVAQGKLRAFAVASARRYERLPQVPTVSEALGLDDFSYEIWGGMFVNAETPAAIARQLNAAFNDVLRDDTYRQQTAATGSTPGTPMDAREASAFYAEQTVLYRRISAQIHLTPQ